METRRVKAKWVIGIPSDGKLKVSVGDSVVAGQDLAEVKTYEEEIVNMSEEIGRLSIDEQKKFKETIPGKNITAGEEIWKATGFFTKKILATKSGLVIKFDEFNNVYIKLPGEKTKTIKSPVKAKISKIEEGKIVLEFGAMEFTGQGLTEGKVWGNEGLKCIEKITDLTVDDVGKIIIFDSLNEAILLKAEVVGIIGAITLMSEKDVRIKSGLPVLALENEEYKELLKMTNNENKPEILLNATDGRLLKIN